MDTVHGLDVYAELWPRLSLHGSIFGDDKRGTCATCVYLSVYLSVTCPFVAPSPSRTSVCVSFSVNVYVSMEGEGVCIPVIAFCLSV